MLGKRLVVLRKKAGLTQQELAKELYISRDTYAQYEIDRRNPDYETLAAIARFHNVTVDYLLGLTDDPCPIGRAEDPHPVDDIKKANAIDFSIIKEEATIWKTEKKPSDIELENFLLRTNIHFDGAPLSDDDKEDLLTYLKVKWERERKKREKGGE